MPEADNITETLGVLFSQKNTLLAVATNLAVLCIFSLIVYYVFRLFLKQVFARVIKHQRSRKVKVLSSPPLLKALARILPCIVIQLGITFVPHLDPAFSTAVRNIAVAFIVLNGMFVIGYILDGILDYYLEKKDMRIRSIKSYVQLAKIVVYVLGAICIIAALIDRSPVLLLSSLGAMSAITMLVFKDTILSFVSGVQISSNDTLRIGDWIEMPQTGANGEVIDIALQVVKVQNFDKTIVSIPTWRLMQESFKNWRGMRESGGRRIKRPIHIDAASVGFLTPEQVRELSKIGILKEYLTRKQEEIAIYNENLGDANQTPANRRRLSNLGTFRAYAKAYLSANARINHELTSMVRMMEPTSQGIPMEIYCFTNTVLWTQYEEIQSDIFDHLITMLSTFGLRIYQQPTGYDFIAFQREAARE